MAQRKGRQGALTRGAKYTLRRAGPNDVPELATLCHDLWPESTVREHARDLAKLLDGIPPGGMPAAVFLAKSNGEAAGFIHVGLRSHADGCDPAHAVGFLEGWYVTPKYRRKTVGASLVAAAEHWARDQGCREMASDTWLESADSQRAHEALGYEVVDRCVHYRKQL